MVLMNVRYGWRNALLSALQANASKIGTVEVSFRRYWSNRLPLPVPGVMAMGLLQSAQQLDKCLASCPVLHTMELHIRPAPDFDGTEILFI